ncbi:MAG: SAM-dependent DNA methyltransferase [Calditrichaeota bacterium]|nr:SAM-dependent DNA methyltransferase [Calditrichota bacterium]
MEKQVVSKYRVTNHGEVYTRKQEVNAMLDLVKPETERIESRFLEPACGTRNFLAEILERKLRVVNARYRKSQLEFERNAVLAVSSIYGIDILQDNIEECRKRLFGIFDCTYSNLYKKTLKNECRNAVRYILERNIIWGDALMLKTVGDNPQPIVFCEWSPVNGSMLKRRDFTMSMLMHSYLPVQQDLFPQRDLFSDLGDEAFIPRPVKEYPLIHFMEIGKGYEYFSADDTDERR